MRRKNSKRSRLKQWQIIRQKKFKKRKNKNRKAKKKKRRVFSFSHKKG